MMKCGGDLDNALQERLLVLRHLEPDFFPSFVGGKKLSAIELLESLLELPFFIRC